ncbi:WhiB family redox-sensing transcriptional regulator [Haloactinopolyspora alba]|uniref:Transcriptional regulator WhiB n=1 Tax=Haloactinopolyspora alba TaxID=648780 RepID=A0A2P8E465_9ACTN|nr:WhiB family transcriptional regulator [Haloactinopolyspora alba]PSL04256.1 WhiB family redox-sensing transcriptional regulator [Haloactinopolyspora alba]
MLHGRWAEDAACRDLDPELFFPVGPAGPGTEQERRALEVCGRCPVRRACLDWALRVGEADGVWGGTTPDERRLIRRRS